MKIKPMFDRKNVQIDIIKLADGARLLRLTEPISGLALEKKLDPSQPVVRQKDRLLSALEAALAHTQTVAA